MEQYIQQLYAFLERREAKQEFLVAFVEEEPNTTLLEYYTKTNTDPDDFISMAFIWDDTPLGGKYWAKLDEKWREKVKAN